MGHLVNGEWKQIDVRDSVNNTKGEFRREPTTLHESIKIKGSSPPESGRYHLYVSYACPWAHRTLLMRALKGLQSNISVSFVSPYMLENGWSFKKDFDSIPVDPILNKEFLREIYVDFDSNFTGRVTVPVLYDKKTRNIINNESSEIIRMLNSEFSEFSSNMTNYYPDELRGQIDAWNDEIYPNINNGVYRCGFAKSQKAYENAFEELFTSLDKVDLQLQQHNYLCGDKMTEADIRLFPTLFRFDSVYHTHFKCNGRLVAQYKGLTRFMKNFLSMETVHQTINMDHVKAHYYYSHKSINPSQIIAKGPIDS